MWLFPCVSLFNELVINSGIGVVFHELNLVYTDSTIMGYYYYPPFNLSAIDLPDTLLSKKGKKTKKIEDKQPKILAMFSRT